MRTVHYRQDGCWDRRLTGSLTIISTGLGVIVPEIEEGSFLVRMYPSFNLG